jgi:hypothetical protein
MDTLAVGTGIVASFLAGGLLWASVPFRAALKKKREAEKIRKAEAARAEQERRNKAIAEQDKAQAKARKVELDHQLAMQKVEHSRQLELQEAEQARIAAEEEKRLGRIRRNPTDFVRSLQYRYLRQTEQMNSELQQSEASLAKANDELEAITAELPGSKAPTTLNTAGLNLALVFWLLLAVAQAVFTGWIAYTLSNGNLLNTIVITAVLMMVLEAPGIIIGILYERYRAGQISLAKCRFGSVIFATVLLIVAAGLSSMASYRATIVNQEDLIETHASMIEARDTGDDFLLSVAQETEAQVNNRIEKETVYFGIAEAGACLLEAALAYLIPAFFQLKRYRKVKAAVAVAQANCDEVAARLTELEAEKAAEAAQVLYEAGIDLSVLNTPAPAAEVVDVEPLKHSALSGMPSTANEPEYILTKDKADEGMPSVKPAAEEEEAVVAAVSQGFDE